MVVKRKTSVSSKAYKYKIILKLNFGPFADLKTARLVKNKMKVKSKKTIFGPIKKGRGGYVFAGSNKYVTPAVVATKAAIERQIRAKAPDANITVTRA